MGSIFKISLRSILRQKRRTFLTAIIIAIGFAIYLFFDSLFTGIDRNAVENMINLTESSVKIYSKAYDADKGALPLKYGISNYRDLESTVINLPGVTGITRRTQFIGELSDYQKSLHVLGFVVDPEKDTRVFTLTNYINQGRYFSDKNANEIIIGKKLADDLNLKLGDTAVLKASTKYEAQNAVDFTIVGLINSSDPTLNENGVVITFEAANIFLELEV